MKQFPFSYWKSSASAAWLSGADGALTINGTTVNILAGSIKDYSSISITNNGVLAIVNDETDFTTNDGRAWTFIGCSGNCTIDSGGKIRAIRNANPAASAVTTSTPAGAAVGSVSYTPGFGAGGAGGFNGFSGGVESFGMGGGGDSLDASGGDADSTQLGTSGTGAQVDGEEVNGAGIVIQGGVYGVAALGHDGNTGAESAGGNGGGGGGAARGAAGGSIYLQVVGTLTVSGASCFDASGSPGGQGGPGGTGFGGAFGIGGSGGGGGGGGGGGKVFIRYKLGSASSANCVVTGGGGGSEGFGGGGNAANGGDGIAGSSGPAGSTDIAAY